MGRREGERREEGREVGKGRKKEHSEGRSDGDIMDVTVGAIEGDGLEKKGGRKE